MKDNIVLAILAKDKEYCLDFYLHCILNQTYDKKKIHLYIRTNDNKDNTANIIQNWLIEHGSKYASVYFDASDITEEVKNYGEHEWNSFRFKLLARLRQDSINYAIKKDAHYFVVDCDNFIRRDTLSNLYLNRHKKVVGPLLKLAPNHGYANFHNQASPEGYFQDNVMYSHILNGDGIKGLIEVDTLHCTYFIHKDILHEVKYDDGSGRYEYAILSDHFRRRGIKQYVDNTKFWGFLFLNDQMHIEFNEFVNKYWEKEYKMLLNDGYYDFVEIGTCDFNTFLQRENPGIGISIEPMKRYFDRLPKVEGVTKLNVAISDKDGYDEINFLDEKIIKDLSLRSGLDLQWMRGSNRLGEKHKVNDAQVRMMGIDINEINQTETVKTMTWKTLTEEHNINHIDYLKLDTEGHEGVILSQVADDMEKRPEFRPRFILFEYNKCITHIVGEDGEWVKDTKAVEEFESIMNRIIALGYTYNRIDAMDSKLVWNG